ncbi:MAG: flagellar hook-basal body complex protein FliE [Rhodospirillales bacterium 12-54-5]|nr:MAG: flagellar hook-basal body complex protein FliE [Rhodospirillales bacterium 12-54-5]
MVDIRFSQAAGAYKDALRAAENIIKQTAGDEASSSSQQANAVGGNSFADMVAHALGSAAASGYKSETTSAMGLTGKAGIADVVTAVNNAETALNTVVAVRDKVITAYNDIIKMQI